MIEICLIVFPLQGETKKCVLISKRGRKNVKSIKKPSVGNRDSYKNKDNNIVGTKKLFTHTHVMHSLTLC